MNNATTASIQDLHTPAKRRRHAHIFEKEAHEHYTEPAWVDRRLFEVETFDRTAPILDPCCGFGSIPAAAKAAGYYALAADIVDRGAPNCTIQNFLDRKTVPPSIATNPPFGLAADIADHALKLGVRKLAMIFPIARLNAAHWLTILPLARVWLLTPRPSMPPGSYITAGHKPQGGRADFGWLVFEKEFSGRAGISWLHRDGGSDGQP